MQRLTFMDMKKLLIFLLLLGWGYAQDRHVPFFFYNVENLFDTVDDPATEDEAFTPEGDMQWTEERYSTKLDSLAKVFSLLKTKHMDNQDPAFFGVCEIENRTVVQDMVDRFDTQADYQIVHHESSYHRGVDVALVYDKKQVSLIEEHVIQVSFPFDKEKSTRDVQYAQLDIQGRKVAVYVNHWPSRRAGDEYRVHVAQLVRAHIDSLQKKHKDVGILLMGDFNDESDNLSLTEGLKKYPSSPKKPKKNRLYDLTQFRSDDGGYTYIYKDQHNLLDHIIASGHFMTQKYGLELREYDVYVADDDQLHIQVKDKTYIRRTYLGRKYLGGYSDHLPVYGIMEVF